MDNRILFSLVGFSLTLIAFSIITQPITAEEEEDKPVPGVVYAIWTNPFYFGEVGLGPSILVYMEQPLEPYLVPGKIK